jgi:hypothetical protein
MNTTIRIAAAALATAFIGLAAGAAGAQATPTVAIDADGTARIQSGAIPLSNVLSEESKAILRRARPTEGPGAGAPPPPPAHAPQRRSPGPRTWPNCGAA